MSINQHLKSWVLPITVPVTAIIAGIVYAHPGAYIAVILSWLTAFLVYYLLKIAD